MLSNLTKYIVGVEGDSSAAGGVANEAAVEYGIVDALNNLAHPWALPLSYKRAINFFKHTYDEEIHGPINFIGVSELKVITEYFSFATKHNIDHKIDFSVLDSDGRTIMQRAAEEGNQDIVQELISKEAEPSINLGLFPLDDMLEIYSVYKDIGVEIDLNLADLFGNTAIHKAAVAGRFDIIRVLAENGANTNSIKMECIDHSILPELLDLKETLNFELTFEREPEEEEDFIFLSTAPIIQSVAMEHKVELVEKLALAGADTTKIKFCELPLEFVYEILDLPSLEDFSFSFDAEDKDGNTVLQKAALAVQFKLMKKLVDFGADSKKIKLHKMSDDQLSALLEVCKKDEYQDIGLDLEEKDNDGPEGKTVLHKAASKGNFNLVAKLIKAGADIDSINLHELDNHCLTALLILLASEGFETFNIDVNIIEAGSSLLGRPETLVGKALECRAFGLVEKLVRAGADITNIRFEDVAYDFMPSLLDLAFELGIKLPVDCQVQNKHGLEEDFLALLNIENSDIPLIHFAALKSDKELIRKLIRDGADTTKIMLFDLPNDCIEVILELRDEEETEEFLLDFDAVSDNGNAAIHNVAVSEPIQNRIVGEGAEVMELPLVRKLKMAGADERLINPAKMDFERVEVLLQMSDVVLGSKDFRVNWEAIDATGSTVIHNAALKGNFGIVRQLAIKGVDTKTIRVSELSVDQIESLIDMQIAYNLPLSLREDREAINKVVEAGKINLIDYMVSAGADIFVIDSDRVPDLYKDIVDQKIKHYVNVMSFERFESIFHLAFEYLKTEFSNSESMIIKWTLSVQLDFNEIDWSQDAQRVQEVFYSIMQEHADGCGCELYSSMVIKKAVQLRKEGKFTIDIWDNIMDSDRVAEVSLELAKGVVSSVSDIELPPVIDLDRALGFEDTNATKHLGDILEGGDI